MARRRTPIETAIAAGGIDHLLNYGAQRVGVVGPHGFKAHAELGAEFGRIADVTPAYTRLRLLK